LLTAAPTCFVLYRQVLIGIVKIGRTYHFVPFNVGAWSPVRDHFGDHFVHWRFGKLASLQGSVDFSAHPSGESQPPRTARARQQASDQAHRLRAKSRLSVSNRSGMTV
jgi:hypothetical protein